jgi:hypothetical protein
MKNLLACAAAAVALSLAMPIVGGDAAYAAKKPVLKTCKMKSGKKVMKWKCGPAQACCITPEGKGVCGMEGLGCF